MGKNITEAVDVFKSCDLFQEAGIPILVERFDKAVACLSNNKISNRTS